MPDWKKVARRLWSAPSPPRRPSQVPPGLYHYVREGDGAIHRFHLRVDEDGGLLLADASAAVRLHPSGVLIAKAVLDGKTGDQILARLAEAYDDTTRERLVEDIAEVRKLIGRLESPSGDYPVLNLSDPSFSQKTALPRRPFGADVALGDPKQTAAMLHRLWEMAIPHVTFVLPERFEDDDLVRSVERAEDIGMIAGVRARGNDLCRGTLLADLVTVGIDHVNVLYLSAQAEIHNALAGTDDHARAVTILTRSCELEVCPVAEVPLIQTTLEGMSPMLQSLVGYGVSNAAFFALATAGPVPAGGPLEPDAVVHAAAVVEESADALDLRFVWYPAVEHNPAEDLGRQIRRGPRCSGDASIRVEADGSVFAARGPRVAGGNLLTDSWEKIVVSEAFQNYRRRLACDTRCEHCPGLVTCAADCPRNPLSWACLESRRAPQ